MRRRTPIDQRQTFAVEDGHLVRRVRGAGGRDYAHRCSRSAYQAVAHYLDERCETGATTGEIWNALPEIPCSQISVALAFLKERGCVEIRWRRCHPASAFLFEDAMVEFCALEAGAPA